jgi:hypothetical protein
MSLTSEKLKDGYYHFFWNGRDITPLWMDFFSGLSMELEKDANKVFIRKYRNKLNKLYPPTSIKE